MLAEFIVAHQLEIVGRCRQKAASRSSPAPNVAKIDHGVPLFLDQLVEVLRTRESSNLSISATAAQHGNDLLVQGCTASQVVHDYGDVCQVITEMAIESHESIGADDFRLLNMCLDDAIASAMTEYGSQIDPSTISLSVRDDERITALSHEVRGTIVAARAAFQAIQDGKVGIAGSTGRVLEHSLASAEDLGNRLHAEIARFLQPIAAVGGEPEKAEFVS